MTEMQKKKTLGMAIASLVFGCLVIFPFLGILFGLTALILGIIALVKISNNKDTLQGGGFAIAGIVLGGIGVIIIPIIALLAAIAIPNVLRARIAANEALAESSVRSIVMSIENYALKNNGKYPADESELKGADFSYPADYNNKTIQGYIYSLDLGPNGYKVTAEPAECGSTGKKIFTGETKEEFSEQSCK